MTPRQSIRIQISGRTETLDRVIHGVEETHEPAAPPEVRRTLNGRLVRLRSRRASRLSITLQKSGVLTFAPVLQHAGLGAEVILHSSIWMSRPAWRRSRFVSAIEDIRDDGETVYFRPILNCRLIGWSQGGEAGGREDAWSMQLEEI